MSKIWLKPRRPSWTRATRCISAGSIARNALIELEAQTAADKYNLVSAQSAYRQNVLTLKQMLQLPWNYSLEIAIPDTIIATALMPSFEEVQRIALATRPEIKYAETGVDIAEMNLKTAKSAFPSRCEYRRFTGYPVIPTMNQSVT